ncbi:antitoxin Xre/MbcA/ParS toxin-binding domain-containing protein [Luteolibacter sp. Populi]|uniref:type II RES/Xre toxin-antitoxin system antitoxin n=1 Tax=Luteolibacter sp. Populi TaxID=3230487 RepID=UPI003466C0EC
MSSVLREEPAVKDSPADVVAMIRRGLPMEEFHSLAEWLGVTEEELAPLLGISRATLHRRKKTGRLEMPESERLIRIGRLLGRATEVFEREQAAREWLRTPALAFRGESPLAYSDTEIGAREVEYLLGRLEHGVFS